MPSTSAAPLDIAPYITPHAFPASFALDPAQAAVSPLPAAPQPRHPLLRKPSDVLGAEKVGGRVWTCRLHHACRQGSGEIRSNRRHCPTILKAKALPFVVKRCLLALSYLFMALDKDRIAYGLNVRRALA